MRARARRSCVHVFPLFTPSSARKLLARLKKLPAESPNSMNRYGRYVDTPAWQRWIDRLVAKHVAPTALACFGIVLAKRDHYAFVVEYAEGEQRGLSAHFDASDVTLNVCLGAAFEGGELKFPERGLVVEQAIGRAIIHHGSAIHRAQPITKGTRANLVVWCKRRK